MKTTLEIPDAIFRRAKAKAADYTYRAMEEAADHNIEYAAEKFGVDKAELQGLKITDMKDNLREGDIAAAPVNNEVTKTMEQMPTGTQGFIDGAGAAQFAASAHTGYGAHAGLNAQSMLRSVHQNLGGIVTDTPALEVTRRQGRR